MKVINNKKELSDLIFAFKANKQTVGFVPTMGALHEGHLSLIKKSNIENDITVISIFVNPTQFNNKNDYNKYPRIIDKDIDTLKNVKCDILFIPTEEEMYPKEDTKVFDLGNLDKVMEGKHRPGHFYGVALIVSKLFELVKPHKAYFGEKDFQQVAIINRLCKIQNYEIEIIACPIIRESDGLAMSSRNMLLSAEQRENVALISKTLLASVEQSKSMTVSELKEWVISEINSNHFLDVEYFDIVNDSTLESIEDWTEREHSIGCIAVHVGSIRLIDNIRFYF
ncbi:MAG: pantoate--beta-alanine ligase [Bacteroidales bacterium]|nr:pantoate--beta-alanine ligase [Bacteroidales bacterium]